MLQTGLEVFLEKDHRKYRDFRLGVVCNQASNDSKLRHISELVMAPKQKLKVTAFFGPQHGIRGEKQDNMVESADFKDPVTGLPVHSLYGDFREPTEAMIVDIDAFLIDLQDIGTRIYTFMYTMANCMRVAAKSKKRVVVLDRPNPIDGIHTEGNLLEPLYASFVGQYPIVVRHGLSMGELALLFNEQFGIHCELDVVRMKGWKRAMTAWDWKRDWVVPSPNIPTPLSAQVFPGSVLFEGTNISEGRGTTHPFEWVGAPYIKDPDLLAKEMNRMKLKGVYFRPIFFQPTYQKGKDEVCGGVQIHITDADTFRPYVAGVRLLHAIAKLHPKDFKWKQPPYEYEFEKMPIDLIAGTAALRQSVEARAGSANFEKRCQSDAKEFEKIRKRYLIYK